MTRWITRHSHRVRNNEHITSIITSMTTTTSDTSTCIPHPQPHARPQPHPRQPEHQQHTTTTPTAHPHDTADLFTSDTLKGGVVRKQWSRCWVADGQFQPWFVSCCTSRQSLSSPKSIEARSVSQAWPSPVPWFRLWRRLPERPARREWSPKHGWRSWSWVVVRALVASTRRVELFSRSLVPWFSPAEASLRLPVVLTKPKDRIFALLIVPSTASDLQD